MSGMERVLGHVYRRMAMVVGRGLVNLINDAGGVQLVQVEGVDGETLEDVEHVQPYGLASVPRAGSTGVLLSVGGIRGKAVIINVGDRRYRLKGLQGGDVALYDDRGNSFVLAEEVATITHTTKIVAMAPEIYLGGEDGAQPVARFGDPVSGGTISGGSGVVKAT